MPTTKQSMRTLLDSGRPLVSSICLLPSPDCSEVMARSGFDWLFVDTQHALVGRETLVNMLRALDVVGTPSMVRVPWNRPELVGWILDAGAHGVISPMVNNAEEARNLVRACRYAPRGTRSWGALRPMLAQSNYAPGVGDNVVTCAMIETAEALDNLDEIIAVDGMDLILVGQSDLSISFGLHPGSARNDPGHLARLRRIADTCIRRGIGTVINCNGAEDGAALREMGFRHLMVASDWVLLRRGAATAFKDVAEIVA